MTGGRHHCGTQQRRQRVLESDVDMGGGLALNGIDYVEVVDRGAPAGMAQRLLDVSFLKPDGLEQLSADHFSIIGGSRLTGIRVLRSEATEDETRLRLVLSGPGDFSPYQLRLHSEGLPDQGVPHMDACLSEVTFGFKVECPSDFDCKAPPIPSEPAPPSPTIDYLTRDWAGFRQLMLDRMSVTMPDWAERNPADLGVTLVELLADAADKVSWMQDAVGTEAYFERSRYRQSLRRHARLLGYQPGEGRNARCAVAVHCDQDRTGPEMAITKGTRFLSHPDTPGPDLPTVLPPDPDLFEALRNRDAIVFEALTDLPHLRQAQNAMRLYNWGDDGCCLPKGSCEAWLVGAPAELHLSQGDLLCLEELIPFGGQPTDPENPEHRQVVRLSAPPLPDHDPVFDLDLTRIRWHSADALQFALPLDVIDGQASSRARGNIVLIDEGRSVDYAHSTKDAAEDRHAVVGSGLLPDDGPGMAVRLRLSPSRSAPHDIVHAAPYDDDHARSRAALASLAPSDPAVAAVSLTGEGETWTAVPDLLASDRFAPHIVIEPGTEDAAAYIRFGDGVLGRAPGVLNGYVAKIRYGGGPRGNIGAGAIAHIVTADGRGIAGLDNPLAAQGGTAQQDRRAVQIAAPQAFRTQRRAVTVHDYAEIAARHPRVVRAFGRRTWTGSWYTITLAIDLLGGGDIDPVLEADLRQFIEGHRLAGHDLKIVSPVFVPLDLVFFVCVAPAFYRADLLADLTALFSDRTLPDGTLGLFHPDRLEFGADVALSPLIAQAMAVPGLSWISLTNQTGDLVGQFSRMDQPGLSYGDVGAIPIAPGEIARLDNDRNHPEMGRVRFIMEGGR